MAGDQVTPKARAALLGDGCTSLVQIMSRSEEVLILRGEAKRIFSAYIAEGLQHPPSFDFWNNHEAIVGRLCGHFIEGDPDYLGMAGYRVWHRHPRRN